MFICDNAGYNIDFSDLFSNDLFNSSIIYSLPKISSFSVDTDYLCREDLIASFNYPGHIGLGSTLFSLYEKIENEQVEPDDSEPVIDKNTTYTYENDLKPFDKVDLLDSNEMFNSQSMLGQENALTTMDINVIRRPYVSDEYFYSKIKGQFDAGIS
jgi:hypothetical protein